jgi:hypothetical protein
MIREFYVKLQLKNDEALWPRQASGFECSSGRLMTTALALLYLVPHGRA